VFFTLRYYTPQSVQNFVANLSLKTAECDLSGPGDIYFSIKNMAEGQIPYEVDMTYMKQ